MPMIRCRYFDDNGRAINGGCINPSCSFIHPTHLRWNEARKPTRSRGRGRGRGESFSTKRPPLTPVGTASNSTDWPSTSTFDSSTWGASGSTLSTETEKNNSWGDQNAFSDKDNGWGTSSAPANGGSGVAVPTWGDDLAADSAWGSGGNSVPGDSNNGWGGNELTSGWNIVRDQETSTWDRPPASGWGAPVDQEPKASPAWGQPDHTTRMSPTIAGPSGWRHESHQTEDSRMSPAMSDTIRMEHSIASRSSKGVSASPSPPFDLETTDNGIESELKIRTAFLTIDKGPLSSTRDSAHSLQSLSPIEIYSKTIRKYYRAISSQLLLEETQLRDERWKRTMNSASYGHGTPMQRIKLERERAALAQETIHLTKEIKNATDTLVELQSLQPPWNLTPFEIDPEEVMKHTLSLRNWMSELPNFHMLAPPPLPTQAPLESEDQQKPLSAWSQLILNVEALENSADQIDELMSYFSPSKYTKLMDEAVTTKTQEYYDHNISSEQQNKEGWKELKNLADSIGERVEAEAIRLAELYTQVHHNNLELQELNNGKIKLVEMNSQIEEKIQQLEQLEQEDMNKIKILTEKIQDLHNHIPPAHQFSVDNLFPGIQQLIEEHLENVIVLLAKNLHGACIQNHDLVMKELLKHIQPIMDLTTEVYKCAQLDVVSTKHF